MSITIGEFQFKMVRFWYRCIPLLSTEKLFRLVCVFSLNWLISFAASANQYPVIIYPISGSSNHYYDIPYSGHFTAVNGINFDASEYYKNQRAEFHVSGFILIFLDENWSTKLDWTFDNGFYSDLYQVDPSFSSNITLVRSYENSKIEVSLQNAFRLGGTLAERACVDTLGRDFHCGTGMPWADYEGYKLPEDIDLTLKLTLDF